MDFQIISFIFNAILATLGGCWGVWKFWSKKQDEAESKEREEIFKYVNSKVEFGKQLVSTLESRVERNERHTTQQFESIASNVEVLENNYRILSSQLMTEHKVDTKLQPIKDEVKEVKMEVGNLEERLSAQLKDLRTEFKDHNALQEMNTQQLLAGVFEIKGYLKAKSGSDSL
jgi:septation ring formation regulator EzrA